MKGHLAINCRRNPSYHQNRLANQQQGSGGNLGNDGGVANPAAEARLGGAVVNIVGDDAAAKLRQLAEGVGEMASAEANLHTRSSGFKACTFIEDQGRDKSLYAVMRLAG